MFDDRILIAREERAKLIGEMTKKFNTVSVKANVPGWEKNIPLAILLTKYFAKVVNFLGARGLKAHYSVDGLTIYGRVNNGVEFKDLAVATEQVHPLGRLIDIDVTLKGEQQSLTRNYLRQCFLCDNPAFVCGKNKTHTVGELLNFFNNTAKEYFHKYISDIIKKSMIAELDIENKFGLVTKTSCGAHKDMNYSLMLSAIEVIKDRLADAFFVGLNAEKTDNLIEKLIPIGLDCEKKMLSATKGANAYKGFIFAGGLLLASSGYTLRNSLKFDDLFNVCADIYKNYSMPNNTFGAKSYKEGFGGIRKEAKTGFLTVKKAQKLINKMALWKVLTFILGEIDDSVLLKRAKTKENYNYFKNLIVNATSENRKSITKECIDNNISIGGSADILICAVLVNKLKQKFLF